MLDLFADKAAMEEHPDSLPGHDSFYAHDLEAFHGQHSHADLYLPKPQFDAQSVKEALKKSHEFSLDG